MRTLALALAVYLGLRDGLDRAGRALVPAPLPRWTPSVADPDLLR